MSLALGCTLVWGVGQVSAKKGVSVLGPRTMVIVVSLGEAGFFLAAYFTYGTASLRDITGAALAMAAGVTGMVGLVTYYHAIARGTISRVGTVVAAYPALTVILALVILGESVTTIQALGVIFLVGSAVLLGYAERGESGQASAYTTVLVVLAFLLWGTWGFLLKLAVARLGEGPTFFYFALSNVLVGSSLLYRGLPGRCQSGRKQRDWVWPAATVVLGSAGVILLTLAFSAGPASLVTPVTGAYPVVTVLIASPVLRERVGSREVLAVLAFGLGLFLVAWP